MQRFRVGALGLGAGHDGFAAESRHGVEPQSVLELAALGPHHEVAGLVRHRRVVVEHHERSLQRAR